MSDFSYEAVDATSDELKITRARRSRVLDTPFVGWLAECRDKGIAKRIQFDSEEKRDDIIKLVRLAARELGTGSRITIKDSAVIFGYAEKRKYTPRKESDAPAPETPAKSKK